MKPTSRTPRRADRRESSVLDAESGPEPLEELMEPKVRRVMACQCLSESIRMKWKRRIEVANLRELHVLGVHGLDQVGPAQVEQPGVVGLGEVLLERGEVHSREARDHPERLQTWATKTLLSPYRPRLAMAGRRQHARRTAARSNG